MSSTTCPSGGSAARPRRTAGKATAAPSPATAPRNRRRERRVRRHQPRHHHLPEAVTARGRPEPGLLAHAAWAPVPCHDPSTPCVLSRIGSPPANRTAGLTFASPYPPQQGRAAAARSLLG